MNKTTKSRCTGAKSLKRSLDLRDILVAVRTGSAVAGRDRDPRGPRGEDLHGWEARVLYTHFEGQGLVRGRDPGQGSLPRDQLPYYSFSTRAPFLSGLPNSPCWHSNQGASLLPIDRFGMGSDGEESESYDTLVDPCPFCALPAPVGDSVIACSLCSHAMHRTCRGLPGPSKAKKSAENINAFIGLAWLPCLCDPCAANLLSPNNDSVPIATLTKSVRSLQSTVETLKKTVEAKDTGLAALSLDPGSRTSYASMAAKNRPQAPPALVTALTSAIHASNAEEVRLRSVVVDKMPMPIGSESDLETMEEFVEFAGLHGIVEIEQVFRMGQTQDQTTPNARPPKLKVILRTRQMQRELLTKTVRERIRSDQCPAAIRNAYLNPSRTWEERRYHMMLRTRRAELNKKIPDQENQWFVQYNHTPARLVKRVNGTADWDGAGDAGWDAWAAAFEKRNAPRTSRINASTPNSPSKSEPATAKPSNAPKPKNTSGRSDNGPSTSSLPRNPPRATQQPPKAKIPKNA